MIAVAADGERHRDQGDRHAQAMGQEPVRQYLVEGATQGGQRRCGEEGRQAGGRRHRQEGDPEEFGQGADSQPITAEAPHQQGGGDGAGDRWPGTQRVGRSLRTRAKNSKIQKKKY